MRIFHQPSLNIDFVLGVACFNPKRCWEPNKIHYIQKKNEWTKSKKNKIYILDLSFILSFFLHACWRFAKQVSTSKDDKSDKQHNGVRACVCAASTWHRSTSHQRHTLGTLHQTGRDVDSADQTRIHSNKVGENTVTQSVIMGLYR